MECEYCQKIIKTKYNLDKHIRDIHLITKDESKYCGKCGFLKNNDEYYKTKYGSYRSVCKECYKNNNKEQYKCKECEKFITKRYMNRHLKNKHKIGL